MKQYVKHFLNISFIIAIGWGLLVVIQYLQNPNHFPIKKIEIHLLNGKTKSEDITNAITAELAGGFFKVNIEAVKNNLLSLPWLAEVMVKRDWPDTIILEIKEHTALAQWGQAGILDTEGVVFYPAAAEIPLNLPLFFGPASRSKEMVKEYLKILQALHTTHLSVKELLLSNQGAWEIKLDNEIKLILGKTAFNERLGRFTKIYRKHLQVLQPAVAYIDLRYTNGLALGWKAGHSRPIISEVIE